MEPGLPKVAGVPMSNQVLPWSVVAKMLPVDELRSRSWPLTGLTTRLAQLVGSPWLPGIAHCGSGVGRPPLAWSSPNIRLTPLTMTKLVSPPPWAGEKYW